MSTSRRLCFFGLGSLAVALCGIVALPWGRSGTRVTAAQLPQPSFAYVTPWSTNLDAQTQALYQNLSNAIAGFTGVPAARPAYYSFYNDGVNWSIGAWGGGVINAVADGDGGYNVTLTVGPIFATIPQNGSANDVGGAYYEIFNVGADGTVTYMSSQDPLGSASGQLTELAN